jgi:6-phosphogluconate dehydrogenase
MPESGQLSDVGVAGLCSAGRILALRLAALGLRVSLWDASAGEVEEFVTSHAGTRGGLVGYTDRGDFVESLNAPRRIVVFETPTGLEGASLRTLLLVTDRLLEYPWQDETVSSDDLAQVEMTLVFQLA